MPHIEHGELHALLDGAYGHDTPDALRIRAHLQSCADCRALLEQETSLRDRANELLDLAAPLHLQTPPFAQVQARARPARKFSNPAQLSWAAMVMLALGVGWFGRDLVDRKEAQEGAATLMESAPSAASPAPAESLPQPREEALSATAQDTRGPSGRAQSRLPQAAAFDVQQTPPPAAPPPPPTAVPEAQKQAQQGSGAVASQSALRAEVGRVAGEPSWVATSLEAAERTLGRRVLLVPGFELIRLEIAATGNDLVRAFQRIPGDGVIELMQESMQTEAANFQARERRAAAPAMAADAAAPVTITIGNVKVSARGPLAGDSLRVLLGRLR